MSRQRGWNGLQFTIPADCEDIVSGSRHLLIEKDFLPVMEIRWELSERKKQTASIESVFKQLQKSSTREFREITPPQPIESFAEKYGVRCLQTDEPGEGISIIWQCKSCGTLLFCRIYDHAGVSWTDRATTLQSLSCHRKTSEQTLWSVQDFRLLTPSTYSLESYSFQAGLTRLLFDNAGTRFLFCRMAPASDKLAEKTLQELLCSLHERFSTVNLEECSENFATAGATPPLITQILLRLKRKKAFCRGVIRHDNVSNRILALICESNTPITLDSIQSLFSHYEIIP
jgi:hypothetical protein